jgi:hypothetical protein
MHYTWNGAFGKHSIELRLRSYDSVLDVFTSDKAGTPEGLCSCITAREEFFDGYHGTTVDFLFDKIAFCNGGSVVWGVPLPIYTCLDGPWFTVQREREYQETDEGNVGCGCNVSSVVSLLTK